MATTRRIGLIWENFGPSHADRGDAIAKQLTTIDVVGIELFSSSKDYGWNSEDGLHFRKYTLFDSKSRKPNAFHVAFQTVKFCLKHRLDAVFTCHYERVSTLLTTILLRMCGRKVFAMGDSKFDDYERNLYREFLKSLFLLPYSGALTCDGRSADYARFLGFKRAQIKTGYDTISVERIRRLASHPPAPDGIAFQERHFSIVARYVPKKNIAVALRAYAAYAKDETNPRPLNLYGSGPEELALRQEASDLGIQQHVAFKGFVQTEDIAEALATSLVLILPSTEEQFGLVTIEAHALGVPTILSTPCGSRDLMLTSTVNGFLVEPSNFKGIAFYMSLLSSNEPLWRKMSAAARDGAWKGDVANFARGAADLLEVAALASV